MVKCNCAIVGPVIDQVIQDLVFHVVNNIVIQLEFKHTYALLKKKGQAKRSACPFCVPMKVVKSGSLR